MWVRGGIEGGSGCWLCVCVCGCQGGMNRSVRAQGQSRACMQTLSKQVMQCRPNQAGHDVATRQRTGKRPVCGGEGPGRGNKKGQPQTEHQQAIQTKQQHKFRGGRKEELMCSFMGLFLQRSVHLLFLFRRRPRRVGMGHFFLSSDCLEGPRIQIHSNHHETTTMLSRDFMSTGKYVFSWLLVARRVRF